MAVTFGPQTHYNYIHGTIVMSSYIVMKKRSRDRIWNLTNEEWSPS